MSYADDISGAPDITAGGGEWDNLTATNNTGEPLNRGESYNVWQKIFLTNPGAYNIEHDPAADGDTVMSLYGGPPSATYADLTFIASDDDSAGNFHAKISYTSPGGEWVYVESGAYASDRVSGQTTLWSIVVVPTGGLWGDWNIVTLAVDSDYASLGGAPFVGNPIQCYNEMTLLSDGNFVVATMYERILTSGPSTWHWGWDVYLVDPTGTVLDNYRYEPSRTDLTPAEGCIAPWSGGIIVTINAAIWTSSPATDHGQCWVGRQRLDCLGGSITPVWTVELPQSHTPFPIVTVGTPTIHGLCAVDTGADLVVGVNYYQNSIGAGVTFFYKAIRFSDGAFLGEDLQQTEVYFGWTQNGSPVYHGLGIQSFTRIASGKFRTDHAFGGGMGIVITNVSSSGVITYDAEQHIIDSAAWSQAIHPSDASGVVASDGAYFDPVLSKYTATYMITGSSLATATSTAIHYTPPESDPNGLGAVSPSGFGGQYPLVGGSFNPPDWGLSGSDLGAIAAVYVAADNTIYQGPIRDGARVATTDSARCHIAVGTRLYAITWGASDDASIRFAFCISPDWTALGFQGWGVPM